MLLYCDMIVGIGFDFFEDDWFFSMFVEVFVLVK